MTRSALMIPNAGRILPLPPILQRLRGVHVSSTDGSASASEILRQDTSLSDRVLQGLRILYSVEADAFPRLAQAESSLGTTMVTSLALCAGIHDRFQRDGEDGLAALHPPRFWWHALECGILALLLARDAGYGSPGEAFLAGFLHDLGKPLLCLCMNAAYTELIQQGREAGDLLLREKERLGFRHPDAGAWMVRRWGLSPFTADAIEYHHEPRALVATALPLVRIVRDAHGLCRGAAFRERDERAMGEEVAEGMQAKVPALLSRTEDLVRETAAALEIDAAPPLRDNGVFDGRSASGENGAFTGALEPDLVAGCLESLLQAGDAGTVLNSAREAMERIFGLRNVLFFLMDANRENLVIENTSLSSMAPPGPDLVVPIAVKSSLLVRAIEGEIPLDSFSVETGGDHALLDRQVLAFLGAEHLLALPLTGSTGPLGVAVAGASETLLHQISGCLRLLSLLGRQTGFVLEALGVNGDGSGLGRTDASHALNTAVRRAIHEANGPLGIIKNYLKILELDLTENNRAREEIRVIGEEIDRVSSILERLRSRTDGELRGAEAVDVNRLISDLTRIMKDSLLGEAGIQLHLDLDSELPLVLGERNGLKQVLINLIHNAVESMAEGGALMLRTTTGNPRQGSPGPEEVVISVCDSGPGVPEAVRPHLFEPFQGTKGGGHAGLGLSIVRELITDMGGTIACENREEGGAEFTLVIPACPRTMPLKEK